MNVFPLIHTDRLLIRRLETIDKELFFRYRSLPEVYQYQTWKPSDPVEIDEFILRNINISPNTPDAWMQLAVCLKDGLLIGDIGIHFVDDFQVEIGYTISPEHQRRGYAAEGVKAVLNYLFVDLKKHRVTASVDPDNMPSIKLLEKLGFRKEAHFIKSFRMDDRWADDCIYAMLEEEWN